MISGARTQGILLLALAAAAFHGPGQATGEEIKRIEFESANFADYRDAIDGTPEKKVKIWGELSMPAGATGKVPAVVLMSTSGGYDQSMAIFEHYRAVLSGLGAAAFSVNSNAPRGLGTLRITDLPYASTDADAYAALNALASNEGIDPSRIAVMGFSRGGGVALQTAFEPMRRGFVKAGIIPDSAKFAAHVGFYPMCATFMKGPGALTGAPVLLLAGALDDLTPARQCSEQLAFLKASGEDVPITLKIYENAHHSWDHPLAHGDHPQASGSSGCPNFVMDHAGNFFILKDGKLEAALSSARRCGRLGGTMYYNRAVRDQSDRDVTDFFRRTLLK